MQIGDIIKIDRKIYVYVNKEGSLERLPNIKWYAHLYLEILQGLNIKKSLQYIRLFCNKYKKV